MQRKLVLIRHAKSSWAIPTQKDFDRTLNDRGTKDAPVMGKRLKKLGFVPDLIVSSTAQRARQTTQHIAKVVGYKLDAVQWEDKLYHCPSFIYEEVIYALPAQVQTVYIIGHNPGITEFANELSPNFFVGDMPTCAVVVAAFEAQAWTDFPNAQKQIILFDYPKNDNDNS